MAPRFWYKKYLKILGIKGKQMSSPISKTNFFNDLKTRIEQHCQVVTSTFHPLNSEQLNWRTDPKEWNILQCFDS